MSTNAFEDNRAEPLLASDAGASGAWNTASGAWNTAPAETAPPSTVSGVLANNQYKVGPLHLRSQRGWFEKRATEIRPI